VGPVYSTNHGAAACVGPAAAAPMMNRHGDDGGCQHHPAASAHSISQQHQPAASASSISQQQHQSTGNA